MSHPHEIVPDFTIEIAPKPVNLVLVRQMINSLADNMGLSEECALQLEMAVDEACANAVASIREKEGERSSSKIRLEISALQHCLRVAIADSGDDFREQYEKAAPFDERTDRTRRRGYGLQIIKTFMDEVHYIHDPHIGNKLILTKYLQHP